MKHLNFLLIIALTLLSCKQNEVQQTENSISQNTVVGLEDVAKQELTLKDLQQLHESPTNITVIEQKGYEYLHTVHSVGGDDKIYVGAEKDTISIFFQNITWIAGTKGKATFDKLKSEVSKSLEYDKEYSEVEIGDAPEIPVYSEIYSYFDKNGIEHSSIIFFTDKTKTKVKKYSFYIGQSE